MGVNVIVKYCPDILYHTLIGTWNYWGLPHPVSATDYVNQLRPDTPYTLSHTTVLFLKSSIVIHELTVCCF